MHRYGRFLTWRDEPNGAQLARVLRLPRADEDEGADDASLTPFEPPPGVIEHAARARSPRQTTANTNRFCHIL